MLEFALVASSTNFLLFLWIWFSYALVNWLPAVPPPTLDCVTIC